MELMLTFANDAWQSLHTTFTDPRKRVFAGYLLCAAVLGAIWLRHAGHCSWKSTLQKLTDRRIWWSTSARTDYGLILVNKLLFLLISPWLLSQLTIATLLFEVFHSWLPSQRLQLLLLPGWAISLSFTIFLFLLDDFSRYSLHRLMHTLPVLWAFHKVHHSATTMTPLTVLRTHPIEGLLFALRSALVQGISIALFVYLSGPRAELVTVLGASIIVFMFNVTGANLRHSHLPLGYWPWLEKLLISPAQHQIHHSNQPRHFNKNYGAILAIWDLWFGSHHLSEPGQTLHFGLSQTPAPDTQRLSYQLIQPIFDAKQQLKQAGTKAHIIRTKIAAKYTNKNRYHL